MINLDHIIYYLRSDGTWILWLSYTASACAMSYALGKEMAFRQWKKLSEIRQ